MLLTISDIYPSSLSGRNYPKFPLVKAFKPLGILPLSAISDQKMSFLQGRKRSEKINEIEELR